MPQTTLIVGATGRVGVKLVRLLVEKGETVRAATRDRAAALTRLPRLTEIADFDFDRPETFVPALDGVAKVFLMARPGDNRADKAAIPFVDAAKKEDVRLIVDLTAMGVEKDDTFTLRILEKYIESTGIPFVHLRPNWFMQNFSSGPMLADIRATSALHLPAGDAKVSFIDVRDIAAAGAAVLNDPAHEGKAYTLTGGQAFDHHEVTAILSRAAKRTIAYVPLSEEAACAALAKQGIAADLVERWKNFFRIVRQGSCAPVVRDAQTILGRTTIALEQFARDYAVSWR